MPTGQGSIHTLSCEDAISFCCDASWGFAIVLPNGEFSWVNEAYAKALNAPVDLIIGTKFRQWTHPDDIEADEALAEKVRTGQIDSYTFAKRYIQRGSTPQRPREIWGLLSVDGKFSNEKLEAFLVQFQPYELVDNLRSRPMQNVREILLLLRENWKLITATIAVLSSLIWGSSGKLSQVLKDAEDVQETVHQTSSSD